MLIMPFGCLRFLRESCLLYAFLLGYLPSIFSGLFLQNLLTFICRTPTPAPTTKPDSANVDNNNNSNTNNSNSTVEKPSITGKVCPVCGYNNCKLGNENRWHCGKCAHSWQEYGQAGSTSSTGNAPKSPKTGLF